MATEDMAAWHAAAVRADGDLQQTAATHKAEVARIRQGLLTDGQKRREIAASYLAAAAKMAAAKRSGTDTLTRAQQNAQEQAFRPPASERGDINAVMASRDARDRARQLTKPEAAQVLLAEAQAAGDHSLARAVAQHAHGKGWHEVTGKWADSQPPAVRGHLDDWAEADHLQSTAGRLARSMAYTVSQPSELGGMAQHQIQALASQAVGRYGGP